MQISPPLRLYPQPKCLLLPGRKDQKEALQSRAVFGKYVALEKSVALETPILKRELQSCLRALIYL